MVELYFKTDSPKGKIFKCHEDGRMPQLGAFFRPSQVLIRGENVILIMFRSHEGLLRYFAVLMSNVRKTGAAGRQRKGQSCLVVLHHN